MRQSGYVLLKALREAAFKRRGKAYAIRHVGTWLAFAAALKTLVLSDGHVSLTKIMVAVEEQTAPMLAEALPPLLPTLFERDATLYRHPALFVRGLEVAVHGRKWLLNKFRCTFQSQGR